jgi:hypothetical protein
MKAFKKLYLAHIMSRYKKIKVPSATCATLHFMKIPLA